MEIIKPTALSAAIVALLMAINVPMTMAQAQQLEAMEPTTSSVVLHQTYNLSDFPNSEILFLMDTAQTGDIIDGRVVATLPSEVAGNGETPLPEDENGEPVAITDNENGLCLEGDNPYPGLAVFVGVVEPSPVNGDTVDNGNDNDTENGEQGSIDNSNAGSGTRLVPVTLRNTGIGFRTVEFADTEVASCVFQAEIAPGSPDIGNNELNGTNDEMNNINDVQQITSVVFVNTACSEAPDTCPLPAGASISITAELGDIHIMPDDTETGPDNDHPLIDDEHNERWEGT